ncbi:hypothetical protein DPEC_G00067620 [Dallia pectoralis]|uniref:Uncharacterized protein n=1 Tax=Dallia pectoralis TaxID=75939 RepID=A0ACC2H1W7_DALPE|nr:hypothetical protein DPEC_G00067620 [Dallia pectoralis]
MNTLGIWATEVEIQALADFTGLNIYTFMGKNWLKYTCNGYRDSDQGIYLQNRGNHYETVVCVKRQEKQSCYRYCDQDIDDSMVEMASDEDGVDDLTLVVQPDKRDETWILAKLGWSLLHTSWPAFLEWLGDRWWGSVSYEKIMSFMARPNIHAGDVVVAAHFGDTRGGVCSITVKTEDAVQTFTVAISGGRYVCTDLVDRDVLDPIDIVREMQSATRRVHLLPRPRGMPEIPNCLSVTEVMKQMRFLMSMMDTVWWGASRSNSSSHQHREMMRQLKDETAPGDRNVYGVLGHNLDEQSLGYLFEVVTLKGRFKVSFDKSSFLVDGTAIIREKERHLHFVTFGGDVVLKQWMTGDIKLKIAGCRNEPLNTRDEATPMEEFNTTGPSNNGQQWNAQMITNESRGFLLQR